MNREPKLIGKSQLIRELCQFIEKAASSEETVLLLGETGVGKEVSARMIHHQSVRKEKPFIKINCANLTENLIESELFGHKKGAYTGAFFDKSGLIEEADGGFFFFDEIGDISPSLQAKLLSVIEDHEIRRLGETRTRKINVRFILATNQDLCKQVKNGKFREDLYYRISILEFQIPPLRERKEDIPLLIDYCLERERETDFEITPDALEKILSHSFSGNIRELENILKRAVVLSNDSTIEAKDITFANNENVSKYNLKSRHSSQKIKDVLEKHEGNKTKAAQELGISRTHFYRILDKTEK